jgi:hypothetical protein
VLWLKIFKNVGTEVFMPISMKEEEWNSLLSWFLLSSDRLFYMDRNSEIWYEPKLRTTTLNKIINEFTFLQ